MGRLIPEALYLYELEEMKKSVEFGKNGRPVDFARWVWAGQPPNWRLYQKYVKEFNNGPFAKPQSQTEAEERWERIYQHFPQLRPAH